MSSRSLFRRSLAMALSLVFIVGIMPFFPAALAASEYSYVDENGITRTVTATAIDSETVTLGGGWYVVEGEVTTTNLTVSGNVNLILTDGCKLTAAATSDRAGINVDLFKSLTIYGQTDGSGRLDAIGNGRGAGIGGNGGQDGGDIYSGDIGGLCGSVKIVGGTVHATSIGGGDGGRGTGENAGGGNGASCGTITITGGSVSVTGTIGGGDGGTSTYKHGGNGGSGGTIIITGGEVIADRIGGGNGADGDIPGRGGDGGTVTISGGRITVARFGGGDAGDPRYFNMSLVSNGGNGSAVTISGGTVSVSGFIGGGFGTYDLDSKHGGSGSCTIIGGSVAVTTMQPAPTNGSAYGGSAVNLTTVELENISEATPVTALFTGTVYTYGAKDMYSDASGLLSLWLPDGASVTKAATTVKGYTGEVAAGASGTLYEAPADTEKPTAYSISPDDGSVDISSNGNITVTFSDMMYPYVGTVYLSAAGETTKTLSGGIWSHSGTVYTITYSGLSPGKEYTITVSGFKDAAGNAMEDDSSHSFSVYAPPPLPEYTYVDIDGEMKTVGATEIASGTVTLSSGWYAVNSDITTSTLTVSGNVNLILTDGHTLTANGTGNSAGIKLTGSNSLTIFGQTQGTGTLNASGAGLGAGIGGSGGESGTPGGGTGGRLTINGGTVIASSIGGGSGSDAVGFSGSGYGGDGGTVNINGGTVVVSDRLGGGDGGDSYTSMGGRGGDGGTVTIKGGTVTVSGKIGGGCAGSGSGILGITAQPGGPGTCVISGGSLKTGSMQPVPTNGSANGNGRVYLTTVTLDGVLTPCLIKALHTGTVYTYGTNGLKSDASGKLYLWLPISVSVTEAITETAVFSGEVAVNSSGTLYAYPPDTEKPHIDSITPYDGMSDVPVNGSISVTFSEMMDPAEGAVFLSAAGDGSRALTDGVWTYSGTVYTVSYSALSYSTAYTVTLSGFKDASGNTLEDGGIYCFSTVVAPLIKSVTVGAQNGNLVSGTAGSAGFVVVSENIGSGAAIALNNINSVPGINLETSHSTGDSTEVTISTTPDTPAGAHPLTLTIDGVTSESFILTVDTATFGIILSTTGTYVFPAQEEDYSPVSALNVTITNTGNSATGALTISLSGADAGSFSISKTSVSDISAGGSDSFSISPGDGLFAGTYTASVMVEGERVSPQTLNVSFTVTEIPLVKSVTVGSQNGTLINGTAGSASFTVITENIESGAAITLDNINSVPGIYLETLQTTADSTEVTISTTSDTPAGAHPLTLTVGGVTSESFYLTVDAAAFGISLSETGTYVFPAQEEGSPVSALTVTITNAGNSATGALTINLSGAWAGSFTLSKTSVFDISAGGSESFSISPARNLMAGTYTASVTVDGDRISAQTLNVSFTVTDTAQIYDKDVTNVVLPAGASIYDGYITASVGSNVSEQLIALTVSQGATWQLFRDEACTSELTDRTMTLHEGENIAYIRVTAQDGGTKIYTLMITKAPEDTKIIIGTAITRKGGSLQLTADLIPGEIEDGGVIWSIETGSSCAVISPAGLLTALKDGTVIVRATARDHPGLYAEITVTISGQSTEGTVNWPPDNTAHTEDDSEIIFSPASIAPEKRPDQPVTATVTITAMLDANRAVNVSVPDKVVTDAFEKAQSEAEVQCKNANGTAVELNFNIPAEAVSFTLILTQASLRDLINADVSFLELKGPQVSLALDNRALHSIQAQSSGDITITVTPAASLSEEARIFIGSRPFYSVSLSYMRNGEVNSIPRLDNGTITHTIAYIPGTGESARGLDCVYIEDTGEIFRIAGSAYDINTGSMIFTTDRFTRYGVGYTAPSSKFTDIDKHWGREAIDYVIGRGLLGGTSDTNFSPDTAMSRGMLVTCLGRLAGIDVNSYKPGSFTDVAPDKYYAPFIEWAYVNGIIKGVGNGRFSPDRAVTREEIAVIFISFAKATGHTLPVTQGANTFADASDIGSYYMPAVTAIQQAGIMKGGSNNKFNPKSSVTRAEISAMLQRYIFTISPNSSRGWVIGEAGQFLYYKDGEALTGWHTIDGVNYCFGANGALRTGWVKDSSGNWFFYSGNTLLTGWQDIRGNGIIKRYYFTDDGIMVHGQWKEIEGYWYYFNCDGSLAVNTEIDGYRVDENGVRK